MKDINFITDLTTYNVQTISRSDFTPIYDLVNVHGIPAEDAYSSRHTTPSHLGLEYALLVETNLFIKNDMIFRTLEYPYCFLNATCYRPSPLPNYVFNKFPLSICNGCDILKRRLLIRTPGPVSIGICTYATLLAETNHDRSILVVFSGLCTCNWIIPRYYIDVTSQKFWYP